MNMAHWDLKYVWYVYYASTNTGGERGRKETGEKKGKEAGTVLYVSYKTGANDIGEDASGYEPF